MKKPDERPKSYVWICQHGTMRRGYVKPTANCAKCAFRDCKWEAR